MPIHQKKSEQGVLDNGQWTLGNCLTRVLA